MTYHTPNRCTAYLAALLLPPVLMAGCASTDTETSVDTAMQSEASAPDPLANMAAQMALRSEEPTGADPGSTVESLPATASGTSAPVPADPGSESRTESDPPPLPALASLAEAGDSTDVPTGTEPPLGAQSTPAQLVFRFGFDRAELNAEDQRTLAEHATYLIRHPEVSISVRGHTDSYGDPRYNQSLSERRARFVADKLMEAGVPRAQVQIVGLGDSEPLALASQPREHRRVELHYQDNYLVDTR